MADASEKFLPTIDQAGSLQRHSEGSQLIPWQNALPVTLTPGSQPTLLAVKAFRTSLLSTSYELEDPSTHKQYFAKHNNTKAVTCEVNTEALKNELYFAQISRAASLREAKIATMLTGQEGIPQLVAVVRNSEYHNPHSYWYQKPVIVTEYIPRLKIRGLHTIMSMDTTWAIEKVFIPLLTILHRVHSLGIFHADLKADQLLLTPDEQLYLSDFGLSAIRQERRVSSNLGDQLKIAPYDRSGTIPYLDPRVLSGKATNDLPNAQTDLYAVGIMLAIALLRHTNPEFTNAELETSFMNAKGETGHASKSSDEIQDILTQANVPIFLREVIAQALTHSFPDANTMKSRLQEFLEVQRSNDSSQVMQNLLSPPEENPLPSSNTIEGHPRRFKVWQGLFKRR